MLFCAVSCGDGEKTYEKGGFSITLPKRFIDITRLTDGADACFSDMKSTFVVTATKLDFEEVGDDSMTAKEFANHIIIANQGEARNCYCCSAYFILVAYFFFFALAKIYFGWCVINKI